MDENPPPIRPSPSQAAPSCQDGLPAPPRAAATLIQERRSSSRERPGRTTPTSELPLRSAATRAPPTRVLTTLCNRIRAGVLTDAQHVSARLRWLSVEPKDSRGTRSSPTALVSRHTSSRHEHRNASSQRRGRASRAQRQTPCVRWASDSELFILSARGPEGRGSLWPAGRPSRGSRGVYAGCGRWAAGRTPTRSRRPVLQ